MPTISINFAAADLTEVRGSFLSHSHWLNAFATLAGFSPMRIGPSAPELLYLVERAASFPVPRVNAGDHDEAMGCLNRAWGTELMLCGARRYTNEDELLRLANSWGAVQAYYAAYGATQALLVAENHQRPVTHAATQKQSIDLWIGRGANLPPWTFAVGSKVDRACAPMGMANGPGRPLATVSSLSACTIDNCWELAEQVLRSTREEAHRIRRARAVDASAKWRQREWLNGPGNSSRAKPEWWTRRPRLSAVEKVAIETSLRPYALLDYLFRLRCKANYDDAKMYTGGPVDREEAEGMSTDLIRITAATLLVHEVRIAKLLGPSRFLVAAEEWVARNAPDGLEHGLPSRLPLLHAVL